MVFYAILSINDVKPKKEDGVSAYDLETYPSANWVALISSGHRSLTDHLFDFVPKDVGMVFKLAADADREVMAARYRTEGAACFLSYTCNLRFCRDKRVCVTRAPDEAALDMFEGQGHARAWLQPLLSSDRAFDCIVQVNGRTNSVCFAFENYGRVWEVGGVFTPINSRGRGLARRTVQTALAVLRERGLIPRYQVSADNKASIALANGIGLQRFLRLTHHLRRPVESTTTSFMP